MSADTSQLEQLGRDLQTSADEISKRVVPVLERGAENIRDQWTETATEFPSPTLKRLDPYSVSIDVEGLTATVGSYDELLALVEDGDSRHAPHLYGAKALEAEEPRFVEHIGRIGEAVLEHP